MELILTGEQVATEPVATEVVGPLWREGRQESLPRQGGGQAEARQDCMQPDPPRTDRA